MSRPCRVLHVLAALQRGGLENWVAEIAIAAAQRDGVEVTIAHREPGPFPWTDALTAAGVRLVHVPGHPWPWRFAASMRHLLDEGYDAVHTHIGPFNGLVLRLADQVGVPVRISHVHCDEHARERAVGWWRRPYHALMRRWIRRHANRTLGVSAIASASLHDPTSPLCRVFPLGIDLARFAAPQTRERIRAELGLAAEQRAILAVGRLDANKRQALLVAALRDLPSTDVLLIAGDGELRQPLAAQAERAGVGERVRLLGQREDVPRLLAAADVFAQPSLAEGFGLSVLEAQAAGLPIVASHGVPIEATPLLDRVLRVPLAAEAVDWAAALRGAFKRGRSEPNTNPLRLATLGHDRNAVVDSLVRIWGGAWPP
ncbi:MAG: glycosyltransferase [Planctomycetota bacterium]